MRTKSETKRLKLQRPGVPTVREQAAIWLQNGKTRNRRPFRPETARVYQSLIETHVNPNLGELPLDVVGNIELKSLASKLKQSGKSAATITLILNIIKEIRGSAKNERGEELYSYKWDAETIDAPEIIGKQQKRPVASAQAVQDGLSKGSWQSRLMLAVLAGSGLRIGEALALRIGPDDGKSTVWIPEESKIIVRVQRDDQAVKTDAGEREVDLPEILNDYLKKNVVIRPGPMVGQKWYDQRLIFSMSEGYYRKIIGAFHSYRRFRVTHLRLQGVPDSLVHFWIGHEDSTVTGRYTEVGPEIIKRKQEANRAGLGFELPSEAK